MKTQISKHVLKTINFGAVQRPGLCVFLVAIAALYLSSVMYGLPQELDPDERFIFNSAFHMLENKTLDPGWYGHPAHPLIYLVAVMVAFIALIGMLLGQFASVSDVVAYFASDVSLFHASGRILTVGFTLASVYLTDRLIRHFGVNNHWRWIALSILCLSPLWGKSASLVRSDMMQIFFMLASLHFCIKAIERVDPKRNLILAGACLGVAVTSKYPGIMSLIPILLCAASLLKDEIWTKTETATALLHAGCACLISAFVAGPYLFLDSGDVLQHVVFEARETHLGHTGTGFTDQLIFYLTDTFPSALSGFAAALGFIGLMLIFARSDAGKLVAALAAVYIVFISSLSLQWARWMLPVLPLLAVGVAVGGRALENLVRIKIKSQYSGSLCVGLCVLLYSPIITSQTAPKALARALNKDTRVDALNWVEQNISERSRIFTETYAPALSTDRYDLYVVSDQNELGEWKDVSNRSRPSGYYGSIPEVWHTSPETFRSALSSQDIEYVLVSDSFRNRFKSDPAERKDGLPYYEAIFEDYELVRAFQPTQWTLGPSIYVLKQPD